jgi:pimeloyl-ACP methyl ester carboxylesterase
MFIPQERYIKIGSINTRYLAEGEGSPVVLVHGYGGSASGWLPSLRSAQRYGSAASRGCRSKASPLQPFVLRHASWACVAPLSWLTP